MEHYGCIRRENQNQIIVFRFCIFKKALLLTLEDIQSVWKIIEYVTRTLGQKVSFSLYVSIKMCSTISIQ